MQQLPKAKNSPWTAVLGWVLLVSSSVIVAQPGFNQWINPLTFEYFWVWLDVPKAGVKEDDFGSSLHFCVLPACCGVTLRAANGRISNGRRCFPAFNGVVQKYLDPSMALDRCILRLCACFCKRLQALLRFAALKIHKANSETGELFDWLMFFGFALVTKLNGSKQCPSKGHGTMQHKVTKQSGQKQPMTNRIQISVFLTGPCLKESPVVGFEFVCRLHQNL